MPQQRSESHERVKAVEREYWAARLAVDRLAADVARDPGALGDGPEPRDLLAARENIQGTYLIRMFAEFETAVKSYWKASRRTHPQAEVLLNRVGALRGMPGDVINGVHAARKHRNNLLHDREGDMDAVTVSQARQWFQTYLARLPNQW
jgi:hypothetical protein